MTTAEEIANKFSEIEKPDELSAKNTIQALQSILPLIQEVLENTESSEFKGKEVFQKVNNKLDKSAPMVGKGLEEILSEIRHDLIPEFNYENKKFFGYVPRSPSHISMLADSLVPFFNQFLGSALASSTANAIEALTIKWIGNMMGYSGSFFGSYTIGGSHANQKGIYTGLVNTLPWNTHELGMITSRRPVLYTSDQAHVCIRKSIRMLGLGMDSLRIIHSNDELSLSILDLKSQIEKDLQDPSLLPVMIIASAGTTNSGAIDDFTKLREIADVHGMWLHVDAAYGGFARLAEHAVADKLKDIHLSDSIATDTHKWLYTPLEGGLTLVKNQFHLKFAFSDLPEYLQDTKLEEELPLTRNFSEYGFALSRRWRGLMVWINFQYYGIKGLSKLITRNIYLTDYFKQSIRDHEELELKEYSQLGIACFQHPNSELNNHIFNQISSEGKMVIGRTEIKNEQVLRISILNENTEIEDIDALISSIFDIIENYHLLNYDQ